MQCFLISQIEVLGTSMRPPRSCETFLVARGRAHLILGLAVCLGEISENDLNSSENNKNLY